MILDMHRLLFVQIPTPIPSSAPFLGSSFPPTSVSSCVFYDLRDVFFFFRSFSSCLTCFMVWMYWNSYGRHPLLHQRRYRRRCPHRFRHRYLYVLDLFSCQKILDCAASIELTYKRDLCDMNVTMRYLLDVHCLLSVDPNDISE